MPCLKAKDDWPSSLDQLSHGLQVGPPTLEDSQAVASIVFVDTPRRGNCAVRLPNIPVRLRGLPPGFLTGSQEVRVALVG